MEYYGKIYRPPSEAHSLIIQATIGCSHNKCTFCSMYKDKNFKIRKTTDILSDLAQCRQVYPYVERIFLADGDALIIDTKEILEILAYIKQHFKECLRITMYASPKSIKTKTDDELLTLKNAGLNMIYMGLESGCDDILLQINKGETASEIIFAGQRIKKAGIKLSVTAISGLLGKDYLFIHAKETAKAFTAMKPDYIGILTLMMEQGTKLTLDYESGKYTKLSPLDVLIESRILIENIDSEGTIFRSNHASNYISLSGTLNGDKNMLLQTIDKALNGEIRLKDERNRGL